MKRTSQLQATLAVLSHLGVEGKKGLKNVSVGHREEAQAHQKSNYRFIASSTPNLTIMLLTVYLQELFPLAHHVQLPMIKIEEWGVDAQPTG